MFYFMQETLDHMTRFTHTDWISGFVYVVFHSVVNDCIYR